MLRVSRKYGSEWRQSATTRQLPPLVRPNNIFDVGTAIPEDETVCDAGVAQTRVMHTTMAFIKS